MNRIRWLLLAMLAVAAAPRATRAQQAHVDMGDRRYPADVVGRWVPDSAAAGDTTHLMVRQPLGRLIWFDGLAHGAGQWVVHWQSIDPRKPPTPWLCDQRAIPGEVDCQPVQVTGTAPARVMTLKDARWRELPDSAAH